MRLMTTYLADNALYGVSLADMRYAWAPLMSDPQAAGLPYNADKAA